MTSNTWPRPWRGPQSQITARRPTVIIATAALIVAALIVAVAATQSTGGTGPGTSAGTRSVSVTTGPVGTVDVEGVPGQLTITGSGTSQVRLSGELRWTGHAPAASVRTDTAANALHLDYICAVNSPCTEEYQLSVPAHTAVVLSQPSGHVIITGLSSALRITAASVEVRATGLRTPSLTASITSGQLTATFAAAPRRVSLVLTSAQATVALPVTGPGYQVSQRVASGYVHVGVPQAASSPDQIRAQINSGELELRP
ncbi:MAG TPA: hypothetical protein VGD68_00465 [Streptosporangiaceae bacterium]